MQQDPLGSFDPRFDVERVSGEAVAPAAHRDVVGPAVPEWPNWSTR
ncbi:hypothetical protein ACFWOB_35035 [Streptomyces sp. NPDC058420]